MQLIQGDCLIEMAKLPDKSIDLILTDPPYGTTACKWDTVIPLDKMWIQLKRIIKDNGAIVLFGSEPFSSYLRISNINNFKYDWIWVKSHPTGFLNAWCQPLRSTENVSVFYKNQSIYNPLIENKPQKDIRIETGSIRNKTDNYGSYEVGNIKNKTIPDNKRMPRNLLYFNGANSASLDKYHPTQKPVKLMEYLIKTYTNEKETVLDFTMGSGTTGVACKQLNRDFIGIELDEKYFKIAENRIKKAVRQDELFTESELR